jgi:uncharacterized repeat protein (TIGR03803 family)
MCSSGLSRNLCALRLILFACLTSAFTVSTPAQSTTATNTTIVIGSTGVGLLQAPDGNFYSPSSAGLQTCIGNTSMYCSYIYKITPSGIPSIFYTFQPVSVASPVVTPNADGLLPVALIVGTDGNFYGAATYGGPSGLGTIFRITPGGVISLLKTFGASASGSDPGNTPNSLIQGADGNLYFTNGNGLYQLTLGGVLSTIYTFKSDPTTGVAPYGSNASSLVQGSDGFFYVTVQGAPGVPAGGTGQIAGGIVKITATGDIFLVHAFAADGSEGDLRGGPLVEGSDGNFYGATAFSGTGTKGGVAFKVTPGGALTVLNQFSSNTGTRNYALFVGGDGNFYGTTFIGGDTAATTCGQLGCGTVFQLTSSGLNNLHNFEGGTPTSSVVSANPQVDGAGPESPLVQASDGLFYGTTVGTIFKLTPTPAVPAPVQVAISPTTILVNNPVTITWKVLNAFSLTAQQCGATVTSSTNSSGPGTWLGAQTGTFSGGVLSGSATITPTKGGMYTYALTCGGNESGFATLKVVAPLNVPAALPSGLVGSNYIPPTDMFDGVPPYTTTVTSGALPPGMSIDPATGVLTGNPQQFGTYTFGLQVVDSDSPQSKVTGITTLTVKRSLAIGNGIVLKGQAGVKYSFTVPQTGGISPYYWSVTAGSLPDGINLDLQTGTLSGTPTEATTMPTPTVTIQVMDNEATQDSTSVTLPFLILPPTPIAAIEFTQSIQVFQNLSDLKTSLSANGEPPMPMISGKPAVMRVYFSSVKTATTVSLQVTGIVSQTKTIDLQPDCDPSDQRAHYNSCPSLDFYFTPPSGSWTTDLVLNDVSGNELQHETLTITSRDTAGIHLLGTAICDSQVPGSSTWNCGDPTLLIGRTELLARLMPTNSVTLDITPDQITNVAFPSQFVPSSRLYNAWLDRSVVELGVLYNSNFAANQAADLAANTYSLRFGIYRHDMALPSNINTDTGEANNIPGRAGVSADYTQRLGIDASASVVSHETGHTLGLHHTNIQGPLTASPPGCYNLAQDPSTDWKWLSNNVQSSVGLEYPFDVSAGAVLDPEVTFELMSYCYPRWISPQRYDTVIETLRGGTPVPQLRNPVHAESTPHARPAGSPLTIGPYWQVSGTIPSTGVVFDPVFQDTLNGTSDPSTGTYSIEEQNSSGVALYTRYFTPIVSGTDIATGPDLVFDPMFAESIPVTSGVSSIVVKDPTGTPVGNVAVTGTAPAVSITSPAAGFSASGVQTVSWTTTSLSSTLTSRVLYSSNSGATWSQLGELTDNQLNINFNSLPGTNGVTALIKVLVSDGVNTGSATSIPFSVGRKIPTIVKILSPAANFVHASADPLMLTGAAYDPDDGMLHGTSLVWTSDVQGALGTGSPLSVSLRPGTHNLTLTATDSDGNSISTSVSVLISGARPTLSLTTATNSSNCVNATVSAAPGAQGANLTQVEYSLNGGANYIGIPTGSLPFTLTVPGTGSVNFTARAYDASGQSAAQSTFVNIPAACALTKANPSITWISPAAITYGTPLGSTQLDASASVAGVFSYSPAIGTVLGAGSQTLNTTFTPTDAVNYAVVTGATTLSVTPAQLTITPANATRTYGSANPAFTFNAAGFVNSDSASVLSGTPVLTTAATTAFAPGSYPITAAQGTLAAANYTFLFASGTLTITKAATASTLQLSAATIVAGSAETITVTVSSAATGTPTGTITFLDGSTALVSAPLANGQASFTTSAFAVGVHSLNASYSGDTNFAPSNGSASITVSAVQPDFTFAAGATSTQTVQAGQVATYSFSLTPTAGGYPAAITFTVSGLPSGATATFTPSSIPANGAAQTVTLNIQTQAKIAINDRPLSLKLVPLVLAFLLPITVWHRTRRLKGGTPFGWSLLIITASLALAAGFIGCGGKGATTQTPQTYTLVVTATSGAIQHNSTLTLVIQ